MVRPRLGLALTRPLTNLWFCLTLSLSKGEGGVHKIISSHPANFAGTPNINIVENNGAVPPGMYNPTFCIAIDFLQHFTPGIVSIT